MDTNSLRALLTKLHAQMTEALRADPKSMQSMNDTMQDLHRLIVTSATYRQSSHNVPAWTQTDSDNRYLWRMNRRKLEAEAVRDSVLLLAGQLDLKMGGPSFRDFVVEKPEHSPHYEYHLHDPEDPRSHRRSHGRYLLDLQVSVFRGPAYSEMHGDAAEPKSRALEREGDFGTRCATNHRRSDR